MRRLDQLSACLTVSTALCFAGARSYPSVYGQSAAAVSISGKPAAAPDGLLVHIEKLAAAGRFAEAERELRTFLSAHPGDSTAFFALGSILRLEDKPKESLAAYTEGAKGRTPAPEDLRIVALDYVLLEDYPDAIKWLERVVAAVPADAVAWYDLGRAEMMQQNFPRAEEALKRSLALLRTEAGISATPESVKAENNLGVTYEGEGRTAEALEAYSTAIAWQRASAHPSEQPLLNYGKLLLAENRDVEAVAPLEQSVRIAPKDPKCHEQLAHALERSGAKDRPDAQTEAQAQMLEAVRLDPSNARLHFQLGLMYRRAGKGELSREQMAISSSLYGSHSTASDR